MSTVGYINVSLEIFGSILSFILILCLVIGEGKLTRLNRLFMRVLALNIAVLLSDATAWMVKGGTEAYSYYAVRAANFCVYVFGYLVMAAFTSYLSAYIADRMEAPRASTRAVYTLCAVAVGLVVLSQFNGMYYTIDAANYYHRGAWFWLSQVFGIVCMLLNACTIFRCRAVLTAREKGLLALYIAMPVLAMAIQIYVYGVALLYIATSLAAVTIYLGMQSEQAKVLRKKEAELMESRIAILLSQIQPHFLFNALTAISVLCETDPSKAKEATLQFAQYLRENLDSLGASAPVPFQQERAHVEGYLALEKMRFGDQLEVEWDIQADSFTVPALSVQPIVENAVKYGVDGSGRRMVRIATRACADAHLIAISDNGPGFDPARAPQDGRAHIGLENVRTRLAAQCGGTLEITSSSTGTAVTLHIPESSNA